MTGSVDSMRSGPSWTGLRPRVRQPLFAHLRVALEQLTAIVGEAMATAVLSREATLRSAVSAPVCRRTPAVAGPARADVADAVQAASGQPTMNQHTLRDTEGD